MIAALRQPHAARGRDTMRDKMHVTLAHLPGWGLARNSRVGGLPGVDRMWRGGGERSGGGGDAGGGLGEHGSKRGLHRGGTLPPPAAAVSKLLIVRCAEAAGTAAGRSVGAVMSEAHGHGWGRLLAARGRRKSARGTCIAVKPASVWPAWTARTGQGKNLREHGQTVRMHETWGRPWQAGGWALAQRYAANAEFPALPPYLPMDKRCLQSDVQQVQERMRK